MKFSTNKEKGNSSFGNLKMYIIPIEEIKNKSTLNICDKYDKYRVK